MRQRWKVNYSSSFELFLMLSDTFHRVFFWILAGLLDRYCVSSFFDKVWCGKFLSSHSLFEDVSSSVDISNIPKGLYKPSKGILLAAFLSGASNSQVMLRPMKSWERMCTLLCCKVDLHMPNTLCIGN